MKNTFLKRKLCLALAVLLCVAMLGCQKAPQETKIVEDKVTQETPTAESETAQETESTVPETATETATAEPETYQ